MADTRTVVQTRDGEYVFCFNLREAEVVLPTGDRSAYRDNPSRQAFGLQTPDVGI